jgi:hypothetical protein
MMNSATAIEQAVTDYQAGKLVQRKSAVRGS